MCVRNLFCQAHFLRCTTRNPASSSHYIRRNHSATIYFPVIHGFPHLGVIVHRHLAIRHFAIGNWCTPHLCLLPQFLRDMPSSVLHRIVQNIAECNPVFCLPYISAFQHYGTSSTAFCIPAFCTRVSIYFGIRTCLDNLRTICLLACRMASLIL